MRESGILGNAEYFELDNRDTYVKISEDKQKAWLYLKEKDGGKEYTIEEITRILLENGVRFGVNKSSLLAMCKKHVYRREILVAKAIPPVEGTDGYYEFTFDVNSGKSKPVIREDGSVDYQSMKAVNSVEDGALLATYHHAVPGSAGKDVCGNELPVGIVKELVPIDGRGVFRAEDDPDRYYAEKSGKVEYTSGKLSIVNVLDFQGDVDQLTGKLEFYGDIHIYGNVEAGTMIKAGKTLTIEGTVEAAEIYAGGDIILKRGIQGSQKAHIEGKGSLFADFIEHSSVKVDGDIEANSIVSSYITSSGRVKLSGKRASIIGGSTYAMMGIDCNTLGNGTEIKTRISSGISSGMLEESEKIQKQLSAIRDSIREIRGAVTDLGSRITPEQQESYKARLQELMARQKEVTDRQKELAETMEKARGAKIQIHDVINVGSEITIDNNTLRIDKRTRSTEYRNVAGMITGKAMVQ